MRGSSAKPQEQPARTTRSGSAAAKKAAATRKRTPASGRQTKPKPKPKPTRRKPTPAAPAQKSSPKAKQTPVAKNKPSQTKLKDGSQNEEVSNDEDVKAEPVGLLIHVKKPRVPVKKVPPPSKMGVSSGKVGKRKNTEAIAKKELLKKLNLKDKTIIELALVAKVSKDNANKAIKEIKEKPEKKKRNEIVKKDMKKEKEEKNIVETKKEPKEKKVKETKKDAKMKKETKEEKPKVEKTKEEQPKVEKPKEEKSKVEKSKGEKTKEEKPKGGKTKDEKAIEEKSKGGKTKEEKPIEDKSKGDKTKEEKQKSEKTKDEKPKIEKPKEDKPKGEKMKDEKPKGDRTKEETPKGEKANDEKNIEDKIKEDTNKEDKIRDEKSKEDKNKEDKVKDDKNKEDKTKEEKCKEVKIKDDKNKEDKVKEEKCKETKFKDDKSKDIKMKDDKSKETKLKDDKCKESKIKDDKSKDDKKKEDNSKEEKESVLMTDDKVVKGEVVCKKEKETSPVRKRTVKPKKNVKEPKKPDSKAIDDKPSKTKVKLEKISPITVMDEEDDNLFSSPPTQQQKPPPKKPTGKVPLPKKIKEEKEEKKPIKKKEPPVKKKLTKKPTVKVKKRNIVEEPLVIERRHREASLNALAKVHCLYENESRVVMNEYLDKTMIKKEKSEIKIEKIDNDSDEKYDDRAEDIEPSTRTLRSAPGMRGVGRHWDPLMLPSSSSSSSSSSESEESEKQEEDEPEEERVSEEDTKPPEEETKPAEKKTRKRRRRCEVRMDLKDMVVTKRMASLNASAMMAATYSVEKRGRGDDKRKSNLSSDASSSSSSSVMTSSSDDEVIVANSKKLAVIVNQDTDLTITGLYTTRSTRHEGFCSIAGMQYRISSTSHTQTEATAVTTETVIHTSDHVSVSHSESGGSVDAGTSSPGGSCKSYTPLGALSSMQPPGQGRPCGSSAFSAIPYHPHPQEIHENVDEKQYHVESLLSNPYRPIGEHEQTEKSTIEIKGETNYEVWTSYQDYPKRPPSVSSQGSEIIEIGDSEYDSKYLSASYCQETEETYQYSAYIPLPIESTEENKFDVKSLITSGTVEIPSSSGILDIRIKEEMIEEFVSSSEEGRDVSRPSYKGYYQPAGPLISHAGPGSSGPKSSGTPEPPYPPPPPHPTTYYPAYDYPAYYSRGYRRPWASTSQMMDYIEPPYPPPPPHPAAAGYYHAYPTGPALPPGPPPPPQVCYTTPGPVPRPLPPYMEQAICPCPMQSSCPKNVHTGPLTGANKRSDGNCEAPTNDVSSPLLPVALALPTEPTGVSPGPPSPARGSAGAPPVASPVLSTARNTSWSPPEAGLLKPVTPPPHTTVVETSPPPAASPPATTCPTDTTTTTTTCATAVLPVIPKKRSMRRTSDASETSRKRRKSQVKQSQNGKNKVVKKLNEKNALNGKILNNDVSTEIDLPLRRNPSLKWSNGWSWEGEPFTAKVFLTTEDPGVLRRCYPAMKHKGGDIIKPRDCILLRSGPRKNLPFVAKISAMWENPEDGEMMVSVLWYYRPEHTEQGRTPDQPPDEIFASRHKDTNSVACIEDKCYVLTYHEYCRYRKSLLMGDKKCLTVVPPPSEGYPRSALLPPGHVESELIFFCRQVYDFRQKKILKKPPSQPTSRT